MYSLLKSHSPLVHLNRLRSFRVNPRGKKVSLPSFYPTSFLQVKFCHFFDLKPNDVHKICSLSIHSYQGVTESDSPYLPSHSPVSTSMLLVAKGYLMPLFLNSSPMIESSTFILKLYCKFDCFLLPWWPHTASTALLKGQ